MKALKWLDNHLEETILTIFLLGMTVIMGIQVFSRFALKSSLSWTEELTRYLFIWCGFLSVSFCTKMCISIKIEQFVAGLSRRTKSVIKVATHTLEIVFFVYMIPFAFSYMMSAVESGQVSPALSIPMYYVQAAPLVAFILVAIRIIQRWIIEFRIAKGDNIIDPIHPEDATPESFIEANEPNELLANGREE